MRLITNDELFAVGGGDIGLAAQYGLDINNAYYGEEPIQSVSVSGSNSGQNSESSGATVVTSVCITVGAVGQSIQTCTNNDNTISVITCAGTPTPVVSAQICTTVTMQK
ncbi:hypothetical protein QN372_21160 [Undibacterium sp. RTI2.1]|uniref:hypothetical protein n=1 Tax=unclassified Undibacterium TaxID=2630295 RepID=UPI002AB40E99|nr:MULTISPECIES: hypothetical protein [unclassified Undibacterium]MDY7537173.1 hypothetical protein [Undibacterium sp. 5I1]MEB0033247.1 hypothetical protein [Undibacterium sp. RTI2.1]MEB0119030.1 hypothetical protein [Undibacterium sp. RTI2.2]MEB0233243.1 hypothetical protein [Undibacterium sp. 10I3]MEB0259874.1 hypothetical protein [Undibacterium sp. 5I1]